MAWVVLLSGSVVAGSSKFVNETQTRLKEGLMLETGIDGIIR
jgi:hypothetical protein